MGHRQIRVVSDGHGKDTVVYLEDGTELHPVEATLWLEAREPNRIELTFILADCDINADLEETTLVCPVCEKKQEHHCPENRSL